MQYQQRIRDLREDRELRQADIAKKLKLTQQQYSAYECGINDMPIKKLIELCELFKVSSDYILGFTDFPREMPNDGCKHFMPSITKNRVRKKNNA